MLPCEPGIIPGNFVDFIDFICSYPLIKIGWRPGQLGIPERDRATPQNFELRSRILFNSGDRPVRDPGNRSGWEQGSFLTVSAFCYFQGLNFDS